MHPDQAHYLRYTTKSRIDKAINSLLGLIEGVAADGVVSPDELNFLQLWVRENEELADRHPFNELVPPLRRYLEDGALTEEERLDLIWLCEKLRATDYFDEVTADMQRLHALVAGIAADSLVTADELRGLSDWLGQHDHLRSCWPYDEIDSVVTAVMSDRRIDPQEHDFLLRFFGEFVAILDNRTIVSPPMRSENSLSGVCAACPEIRFEGATFCFTGSSSRYSRKGFHSLVTELRGTPVDSVSSKLNYLVIGAAGNPCWAYACYGRKVEKAVDLRKQGARIVLVHENDFQDAVVDAR